MTRSRSAVGSIMPLRARSIIRVAMISRPFYFGAWTRTISSLISDDSRDENQLAKIVAAEAAGLTLLAELVASLKKGDHQGREESVLSETIAA